MVSKIVRDFLPLLNMIDELMQQKKDVIVAIDGNSAAGKSSLAGLLKSVYTCNIFPMDDFFLMPEQRTAKRFGEPGGNIDYERFGEEVIKPLKSAKPFTYRPFDCGTGELTAPVSVTPKPLSVVEGVYCLHPRFIGAYDIKVFLSLGEAEQRRRLYERDAGLYDRFMEEWIPLENRYFDYFQIPGQCDLVFNMSTAQGIREQDYNFE